MSIAKSVHRVVIAVVTVCVATTLLACSSGGGASPANTQTPTPPAATATPAVRHSGIGSVDAVIDAVASGDPHALAQLMRFPEIPCTTDHQGIGRPPDCPDGVADSTPIEALPIFMCEGVYIVPGQQEQTAKNFIGLHPARLSGVYEPRPRPELPDAKYAVMFASPGTDARGVGHPLFVSDDGVVGVWFGCNADSPDWIAMYWNYGAPVPLH